MNKKSILVIIFFSIGLIGCTTTIVDLKNNSKNKQEWEVAAPVETVFKKYKEYADQNMAGGDFLWSGGLRVKGFFYGRDAELYVKMGGNSLFRVTYLYFNLKKEAGGTLVTTWYYNGAWESNAQEFITLLPTKILRSGS
ncbi:MAG: hypothetical protein KGI54_13110 [Pseudomonadota bacterium]|nr:hypothetical protein [Pseudomonadota bacterium]